jgi:hypothetical protein
MLNPVITTLRISLPRRRGNNHGTIRRGDAATHSRGGARVFETIDFIFEHCEAAVPSRVGSADQSAKPCTASPVSICCGCRTVRCGRHARRTMNNVDAFCTTCGDVVTPVLDTPLELVLDIVVARSK